MASAFRALADQVDFVACIGEEVAGLEAIGHPEVFAQAYPGLLRGYLIDAIDYALVRARQPRRSPRRASRSASSRMISSPTPTSSCGGIFERVLG